MSTGRTYFYLLDERGEPKPVADMMTWAEGRVADVTGDTPSFIVGKTIIGEGAQQVEVSTAFLFLDHNRRGEGPPVLWETMVFGLNDESLDSARCSGGREQAEAMHARWVEITTNKLFPHVIQTQAEAQSTNTTSNGDSPTC